MKNAIKFFWIIALIAVIGFSMMACGDDDGGGSSSGGKIPSGLVARWYNDEECTSVAFTINSNGKMNISFGTYAISVSNDTITFTDPNPVMTVKYMLNGKVLTLSDNSWTYGSTPWDVNFNKLFGDVYYKE
jgi:hypothetical protein